MRHVADALGCVCLAVVLYPIFIALFVAVGVLGAVMLTLAVLAMPWLVSLNIFYGSGRDSSCYRGARVKGQSRGHSSGSTSSGKSVLRAGTTVLNWGRRVH